MVTDEKSSGGDFVIVVMIKRVSPSFVNSSAIANITKNPRIPTIGARSSSFLSVVQKRVRRKYPFISRFSSEVKASDVENSLRMN
jgi:hypothetical protein